MDYDTFIEIMKAQSEADRPGKPKEELVELALKISLQRHVDKHIAVCSTYISGREYGFSSGAAVFLAVQIAKKYGLDEDKAMVAAELGAERYDPRYDHEFLDQSSDYHDVD